MIKESFCKLSGRIINIKEIEFNKTNKEIILRVKKFGEEYDDIIVRISNKLLTSQYNINDEICITGKLYSYNEFIDNKNRIHIYVLADKVEKFKEKHFNSVQLNDCKIFAVKEKCNGEYSAILTKYRDNDLKTDYFPCKFSKKHYKHIFGKKDIYINIKAEIVNTNDGYHELIVLEVN